MVVKMLVVGNSGSLLLLINKTESLYNTNISTQVG